MIPKRAAHSRFNISALFHILYSALFVRTQRMCLCTCTTYACLNSNHASQMKPVNAFLLSSFYLPSFPYLCEDWWLNFRVCVCVCARSPYLVCVLCRGGMSLCILVSFEQQVHQSWNCTCLSQWCLISWAQCEIPDESNCGLDTEERSRLVSEGYTCSKSKWYILLLFEHSLICTKVCWPECGATYLRKPQGWEKKFSAAAHW